MPKLKPYPKYKPTNTQWLGDIPQHWEVRRLKTCVQDVIQPSNGVSEGDLCLALEHVESWTGKYKEAGPDESLDSQTKRFMPDDVLFGKLRPYLAKVARPNREGICVGEFLVLRADSNSMIPNYLEQLILSKPVIEAINSSTFGAKMPRTDYQFIGNMHIPLPPLPEQRAIADYLDHQTALTDSLIAKKQRMTELLSERRQSIITHAVTKGLDPQAPTRQSGIQWIGDIPQHWKVMLLKRITRIKSGVSLPESFDKELGRYEVYGANGVIGFSDEFLIQQPTLIVGRVGTSGAVNIAPACTWISDNALMLTELPRNIAFNWLGYVLSCMRLEMLAEKNAQPIITATNLSKQHIPVPPPLAEQRAIADYLDRETSLMDALTEKLNRQIELLAERRQSLITHAVTGKIDIRDHNMPATPA